MQDLLDAEAARAQAENELATLLDKFKDWLSKRRQELAQLKDVIGDQEHAIRVLRGLQVPLIYCIQKNQNSEFLSLSRH